jgi:hypothetical protein
MKKIIVMSVIAVLGVCTLFVGRPAVKVQAAPPADPHAGFKPYTDTYKVQHPFNLPESARFSVTAGPTYNAWIFKGDKGFTSTTKTGPRTEMRWNLDWTVKEHMWEADVNIDPGSQGSAIMQVHATACACEPIYVQVLPGGNLRNDNGSTIIAPAMWGKWFHMLVAYDPVSGNGRVWINGSLVLTRHDPHPLSTVWYFKNGVYGITGAKSETHYKNFQFWTR